MSTEEGTKRTKDGLGAITSVRDVITDLARTLEDSADRGVRHPRPRRAIAANLVRLPPEERQTIYAASVRRRARLLVPMATVTVATTLCAGTARAADDDFWGPDKALHFGVSVGLSAGGYAASSLFLDEPWQRALAGSVFSLTLGAGKEGFDALTGGDASAYDFAWGAAGTLVGAGLAFTVDVAWLAK